MAGDEVVGPPERLHPGLMLTTLGSSLRSWSGAYALIAYLFVTGRSGTAFLAAGGVVLFVLASLFLYWLRFTFRIGEHEIRIDSGILSRTHRSIPFDRIQDVGIVQGPIARALGLAAVTFETGGSAGGEPEGILHAIPLRRAEDIRLLIRERRSDVAAPAETGDAQESEPVFAMDGRRLALAGLFNFSLALFAGLFGLTQTMGDVMGFDPLEPGFWRDTLASAGPLTGLVETYRNLAIVLGIGLLLVAGVATGIIRTVLRDFGFRLDRAATGLRRRRGLLTKTDVTLPLKRAQAALVATGPVRDAFAWRALHLQSLAQGDGGGDHVLAPLARDGEIAAILGQFGWRPLPAAIDWSRVSRAFVWTFVVALSPLLLVLGLMLLALIAVPLVAAPAQSEMIFEAVGPTMTGLGVALAVLGIAIMLRVLAWRHTGYTLDGDRLLVRGGWWRRRTVLLPLDRIQSVDLAENFVGRRFGIASLVFGVAGGRLGAHRIVALPRETARALRDRLLV